MHHNLTAEQIAALKREFPGDTGFSSAPVFEPPFPTGLAEYGLPADAEPNPESTKAEPLPRLRWLDMSNWDSEPVPQREWAIRDRVPLRQAGLFSGEGGTGKSIIELMKNVAHVAGKDWLGTLPEPSATFYLGAEDDKNEIHIRLAAIAKHYGVTFKQLVNDGLHVLPLLGEDATLCAVTKGGRVEVTALYRQIHEAAGDIRPINISIDTLSRAFAGNEIDRVQVYAFAMHMQALAMVAGGSVTVLSHPSLAGIASGSGLSGSTGWHGAFRFRQYLKGVKTGDGEQPDNDLRELEYKKNQYGPLGGNIVLRYHGGLFLPEGGTSSLDKLAHEARAEELFLALLRRFTGQGRNVSDKQNSPNFAPTAFADETDARKDNIRKSRPQSGHVAAVRLQQDRRRNLRPSVAPLFQDFSGVRMSVQLTVQLPCSYRATSVSATPCLPIWEWHACTRAAHSPHGIGSCAELDILLVVPSIDRYSPRDLSSRAASYLLGIISRLTVSFIFGNHRVSTIGPRSRSKLDASAGETRNIAAISIGPDHLRGGGRGVGQRRIFGVYSDLQQLYPMPRSKLEAAIPTTGSPSNACSLTRRRPSSVFPIMTGTSPPGARGLTSGLLAPRHE